MNGALHGIAVLVKTFPKLSETFILEEILGLERLGVELTLYALQAPTDRLQHDTVERVRSPVRYVEAAGLRTQLSLLLRHPLRALRALLWVARRAEGDRRADFALACALAQRLQRDGIRHLHAHFASRPAGIAELTALLCGIGYSISAHAKDIYTSAPEILRRKLGGARFTVTCTQHNVAALRACAAHPGGVHAMYHGIDAQRFRAQGARDARGTPLILSVGRLREKKGFATLIDACALLRTRGVDFACEIVGYGEEQERLQAAIAQLRLDDHVRLAGTMNHAALIRRYDEAAVFAAPSQITADGDRDGIPNVMLEAMAMELPVVASRVSGIPEVIEDGINGALVEPGDAHALADALTRVLADAPLRARLGAAARRTVLERFDNDRNLELVVRLLREALAAPPEHAHEREKAYA